LKQIIKISETIEVVLTQGVCGYEDVLNDFENAKHIRIVTYNISKQLETRLNKLRQLNQNSDIKIITNIPGRFEQYYGAAKDRANKTIVDYMKKLSPSNFTTDSSSFFNFNNHSKIFATENIAYIGSANFSEESDNNFECGVLFTDKTIVSKLINELVSSIENDSILFLGKKHEELLILIQNVFSQLTITYNTYKRLVSNEYLTAKNGEFYYDPKIDKFNLSHIEDLLSAVFQLEDFHFSEQFQQMIKTSEIKYDFQRINRIIDIVSSESSIFDFASFDFSKTVDDYMSENSIEIVEDTLEGFSQNSIQNASDTKEDLIGLCETEFIDLFELVEEELESLKEIIVYLEPIISEQETINNTL
jgi:hypothetical protein